ncbi:poly-beta-1,6 N-acetyl-D-glucosamine export porin PgaA [Dyella sp. Tek66A03]|uniref:poly-beta-1,6 N-acetyl-D-glucosamine export porin PgaA n=1 Tax=Dyella sp. Tek66A03 TaxID=3458298 RepID=UPI00403EAD42
MLNLLCSMHAFADDRSDEELQRINDSLRILERYPNNPQAREDIIKAMQELGLFEQTIPLLPLGKPQTDRQLEGDLIALQIRNGIIDRDTLCGSHRFDRLDAAIAATDLLGRQFLDGRAPGQDDPRRLSDRIVALAARRRYAEAIQLYEAMKQRGLDVPAYALRNVAGSYLDQRKASAAVDLYRQALVQSPDDFDAHVGLFYALSDMGDYPEATRSIDAYAAALPLRRHLDNKYNGERLSADVLADRARIYSDQLDEAQRRLSYRLSQSPYNMEVRQAMASLALTRGWPRTALQMEAGVTMTAPCDASAFADLSETALTAQDWTQGRAALRTAEALDRDNAAVRRAETSMDLHDRFELSTDVNFQHSPTNSSNASSYFGNDDWNANTILYSPPLDDRWRLFLHNYTALADFSGSWTRWVRDGAGVDWRLLNWHLAAEVNGGNVGGAGGIVSVGWAPNDHWTFDAEGAYRTNEIPLKAVHDGIYANDATLGAEWRLNESLGISARATRAHFTDGNQRTALSVQWAQRWVSNDRWHIETLLGTSGSSNSLSEPVNYFNPRRDHEVMLTGIGDYVTWRNYDYLFTQRLEAGVGRYGQQGYPAGDITYLRYAHAWQLGRAIEWHYGIAVLRRPYDGVRETQIRADMHLLWRF